MIPNEVTDWVEFLKSNGCSNVIDTGEWIMCNCIFHGENNPSFGVHRETGKGHCFVCGWHNWEDICQVFGISSVDFVEAIKENQWEMFKKKVLGLKEPLKYLRYGLPDNCCACMSNHSAVRDYLKKRHIILGHTNNIGYCTGETNKYNQSIIFPVYDEKGILFFQARYLGQNKYINRWRFPPNCAKWKSYYGWYENCDRNDTLIFTEGPSDVLSLASLDLPAVAAKDFSPYQIGMIVRSGINRIFLLYDNDPDKVAPNGKIINAGREYTDRALRIFQDSGKEVIPLKYLDGVKDAGDLTSIDQLLENNTIKLSAWYDRLCDNL